MEWEHISEELKKIFSEKTIFSKERHFAAYAQEAISKKKVLLECAGRFGSPLYVLDEEKLIERAGLLKESFREKYPLSRFFYAAKSNDLPALMQILKGEGYGADVASLFELELALKLGFEEIIFTSPVKKEEEVILSIRNSKRVVFDVDNLTDLKLASGLASMMRPKTPLRVSLRVLPAEHSGVWHKFGFAPADVKKAALAVRQNPYLSWAGIHFHSSWNNNPNNYVANIRRISDILKGFTPKELETLSFINIGGGFLAEGSGILFSSTLKGSLLKIASNVPDSRICQESPCSIDVFASRICKAFRKHIILALKNPGLEIWVEPGRFVSALPTYILLKVHSVKDGAIKVNGGINLVGSANFDFEYFPIVNISRPSLDVQKAVIYGPLCDPDDHWGYNYFGRKCLPGDTLAVMHQGAYTFSTAWRWQQPTAAYATFNGNNVRLAKKREGFKQRYSGCSF